MIPNVLFIIVITLASMHLTTGAVITPRRKCRCRPYRDAHFLLNISPNPNETHPLVIGGHKFVRPYPTVMFFQDEIDDSSDAARAMKIAHVTNKYHNFILPWMATWLTYSSNCPCPKGPPSTGIYAAQMLKWLSSDQSIKIEQVHLIGWGTGAAVCAEVARELARLRLPKVGRITGLDPIEKSHDHYKPGRSFLDRNDATFVDIIHTSADGKGVKLPLGHADFYVNGGESQPGCESSDCHHARAWMYYVESVSPNSAFRAMKCNTWPPKDSDCSEFNEEYMGYYASNRSQGIYQVITNPKSPFAPNIPTSSESPKVTYPAEEDNEVVLPCDSESQEFPNTDDDNEDDLPVIRIPPKVEDHGLIKGPDDDSGEDDYDSSCENELREPPVFGKLLPNEIAPMGYYSPDELSVSPYDFVDRPDFDAFQLELAPLGYYESFMISGA